MIPSCMSAVSNSTDWRRTIVLSRGTTMQRNRTRSAAYEVSAHDYIRRRTVDLSSVGAGHAGDRRLARYTIPCAAGSAGQPPRKMHDSSIYSPSTG